MRLEAFRAIEGIHRPATEWLEGLLRHEVHHFRHRQHTGPVARLLLGRTVRHNPFSHHPFLLRVDGELGGVRVSLLLRALAKVRAKPPMRLWRDLSCESLV